jgi:hypothetical protein
MHATPQKKGPYLRQTLPIALPACDSTRQCLNVLGVDPRLLAVGSVKRIAQRGQAGVSLPGDAQACRGFALQKPNHEVSGVSEGTPLRFEFDYR